MYKDNSMTKYITNKQIHMTLMELRASAQLARADSLSTDEMYMYTIAVSAGPALS